jgi:hypothetical protein
MPSTNLRASNPNMDARLLICWHPTNIYQACVMFPEIPRAWTKTYYSKLECMTELRCIDILTPTDADEALASDFDVKDRIVIVRTDTDPETLREAGFDEKAPQVVN